MSDRFTLHHGDCIEVMRSMPDNSVDSIVTDPPYGLEFMGKDWDAPWKGKASKEFNTIEEGTLGGFTKLPNHSRVNNTKCLTCDKWKFSSNPCSCETPNFPNARLHAMTAFQEWFEEVAVECLRILKPGGHLLAFGGSRTYHRLAVAIEDAGFEIRDQIQWIYGSGFPKSLDVGKAIDKRGGNAHLAVEIGRAIKEARLKRGWSSKQADQHFCGGTTNWTWYEGRPKGQRPPTVEDFARIAAEWTELAPLAEAVAEVEREVLGEREVPIGHAFAGEVYGNDSSNKTVNITAPATPAAQQWQGWGTALKPAHEPIVVARKPLTGTVAANVLAHGVGALNIDGCRVGMSDADKEASANNWKPQGYDLKESVYEYGSKVIATEQKSGRWPANVIHDGSDEVVELFPDTNKGTARVGRVGGQNGLYENGHDPDHIGTWYGDSGSAARFFYCAKANKRDRNEGLGDKKSTHPTVKPTDLMRYLIRLVTPQGATILDPFMGSGSTGKAAMYEGVKFIGIEQDAEYLAIAKARIEFALNKPLEDQLFERTDPTNAELLDQLALPLDEEETA